MGVQERKTRERQEREQRIVVVAREIAERDGWAGVTIRRLADKIEYSPPVLYGHFPDGRDGIVNAVALAGFRDFTAAMQEASTGKQGAGRLESFAEAYLAFASKHAATYEAMFSMRLSVAFAQESTPDELRDAFAVLAAVVRGTGDADAGARAELYWSTLHGIAVLTREQRLIPEHHRARIDALVALFS